MSIRSFNITTTFICLILVPSFVIAQQSGDEPKQPKQSNQLFEIDVVPPPAKPGEFVLCPSRQFYDSAVEKGADKTTFIYYAAKMEKVGDEESTVKNLAGQTFQIPNYLIVSIPAEQECKTGDVILTWWQTGSGMQRAIVVGGKKTEPVVRYLDISYDNPSGAGKKEETLKANSFFVLNQPWQVGSTVAIETNRQTRHGQLLAVTDKRVLVREFAGKIKCYERKLAKPVPIVPEVSQGDVAMAAIYGSFKPVTVKKVDTKIGRVFVNFQLGRKDQEKVLAFGDVYKK